LDLARDQRYGHIEPRRNRTGFPGFRRHPRGLYPPKVRIAIVLDSLSPHLTTKRCRRVADRAAANNVELAHTPTNSS
jgi:hypothetical protein